MPLTSIASPRESFTMPVPSGVYDKLNVILDDEVRGLTLAPKHYALLRSLARQWQPVPIESFVVEDENGRWTDAIEMIKKGLATLGEPFDQVLAITMIDDSGPSAGMAVEWARAKEPS